MKSKTTGIWFALAVVLAAFIWLARTWLQPAAPVIVNLLPGLRAADVTAFQVAPAGQREISVVRTNGGWQLLKPLVYPAQIAAVEGLAKALERLTPDLFITGAELRSHTNAEVEFGFAQPQFNVLVETRAGRRQLVVGNLTAPGDQVFVRVVGSQAVAVADAAWLKTLPQNVTDWRDRSLIDGLGACSWIVLTNGARAMEFRRETNSLVWRMIRPIQARADSERLATAFQQTRAGSVTQFVNDDPKADLSRYGLLPAALTLWLGQGTNLTAGVDQGSALPDNPAQVFARRAGWNAVLATSREAFDGWRGTVNEFRDPHLLNLAAPVAEIEVYGADHFTLQQRGSNDWSIVGEKFPADADLVRQFLGQLAGLRIAEFVKDVVTEPDLKGFGLAAPPHQIILRGAVDDTNSVLAQVLFGNTDTNRVLVKRADEDFVYALKLDDVANLTDHGWQFRDRRVWNFSETNVASVTLRQNGQTRQFIRTGVNKWSPGPDAGSQGVFLNPLALEETFHRLGELTAAYWFARNATKPEDHGLAPDNLNLTIELKSGEKLALAFGTEIPEGHTALAAVTLDGERWVFLFPPTLYQFVTTYLTIPPPSAPPKTP